jgi:hypothetical protein
MLRKLLEFDCMHENKIFFYLVKGEINLKFWDLFWILNFFKKRFKENWVF